MSTSIEIAVTCTSYQHRLCWMLSSLLQQEGDCPKLIFSVGYPVNNGKPTTEEVCQFFRGKGLDITEIPYPDTEVIQYRGLVRNRQLEIARAEWLLFADTDITYSPHFFEDLGRQLETSLKDERLVMSTTRISLDKDYCKDYFSQGKDPYWDKYPCVVPDAGKLESWPIYKISKSCGAGYFQLVNTQYVREKFGRYVDPAECADRTWSRGGHKTRSDGQFRKMIGGIRNIKTLPQYHLNHIRDNELGFHTAEQR